MTETQNCQTHQVHLNCRHLQVLLSVGLDLGLAACEFYTLSSFIRTKAQTLVDSLSELMVDASLGTIQCLEEIVSDSLFLLHHCLLILDYSIRMHEPTYI